MIVACGEDEPERNPPPVGSGGGGPIGGASGSATDTDGTGSDGSSTGGSDTGGPVIPTATIGGTGDTPYAVLTGSFVDGGGGYALPITCRVKFHSLGEINPSNGVESGETFNSAIVIDAYPQAFTIMSDEIGDVVMIGDAGYVSSECDIDGDNFFDDAAGAYYPGLPMTQISIPASSIILAVGPF